MLSAVFEWLKDRLGLSGSGAETDGTGHSDDENDGPDLYECEGCGAVFISRPDECPTCEDDNFTNVGKFE